MAIRDLTAFAIERSDAHADGLLPLHGFSAVSFGANGSCLVVRK